jgi:hypothetical protein
MKKNVVARPPKLTEDRRIKGRGVMATKFLWQLMAAARAQASPYTWIKEGGLDAEEFLECLESGRPHPLLDRWRDIKGTTAAGRPAPTARDRHMRRLVVLAVIALRRVISTDAKGARRTVAAAMVRLFEDAPSAETIHHWERQLGPITPEDEKLLEMVITNAKKDPTEVVERFVHFAHTILTPAPFSLPTEPTD